MCSNVFIIVLRGVIGRPGNALNIRFDHLSNDSGCKTSFYALSVSYFIDSVCEACQFPNALKEPSSELPLMPLDFLLPMWWKGKNNSFYIQGVSYFILSYYTWQKERHPARRAPFVVHGITSLLTRCYNMSTPSSRI